jgi:KUP system potassium uptake protein
MASLSESEVTNRGSMWELDQNLDQPMDEEAGRLKNMYREKVWHFSLSVCFVLVLFFYANGLNFT